MKRSKSEDAATQCLLTLGVIEEADTIKLREVLQEAKVETLVDLLLAKRFIQISEIEEARALLEKLVSGDIPVNSIDMRVIQADLTLLLSGNFNKQIVNSCDRIRAVKQRITGEEFPILSLLRTDKK